MNSAALKLITLLTLSLGVFTTQGCTISDEWDTNQSPPPSSPQIVFNLKKFDYVQNTVPIDRTDGLCIYACINMWENYMNAMGLIEKVTPMLSLAARYPDNGFREVSYWIDAYLPGVSIESNTWSMLTKHIYYRIYPDDSDGNYTGEEEFSIAAVWGPDYERPKTTGLTHAIIVTDVAYPSDMSKPVMIEILDSNPRLGQYEYGIADLDKWRQWLKGDGLDSEENAIGYLKDGLGENPFPNSH